VVSDAFGFGGLSLEVPVSTLGGLRSKLTALIPKLRRACCTQEVAISDADEGFVVRVSWEGGEHERVVTAADIRAGACPIKDEIIRAVLRKRLP
jgi:hypothetical protein